MLIDKAKEIMMTAHKGQVDKAGRPYYLHPQAVSAFCVTENEKVVALLHDVLEDSNLTKEELARCFPSDIVDAVLLLTHEQGTDYMDYVAKIKKNPLARAVKISDLRQNISLNRLNSLSLNDAMRAEKYAKALVLLLS